MGESFQYIFCKNGSFCPSQLEVIFGTYHNLRVLFRHILCDSNSYMHHIGKPYYGPKHFSGRSHMDIWHEGHFQLVQQNDELVRYGNRNCLDFPYDKRMC